jgi:hypothetical protein
MRRRGLNLAAVAVALSVLIGAACSSGGTGAVDRGDPSDGPRGSPPPPAPIVDIMDRTTMTAAARTLFLAARPRIETKAELANHCRSTSGVHTLGCFRVVQECGGHDAAGCTTTQIHLLQIDRADVSDLIYVSAAHEMLHAAYEKIPEGDRQQLDRQLDAALGQLEKCRVDTNLSAYAGRSPAEMKSELHSVLATEFAVLPPGLQEHFSRYFANRQLVVAAHDRTLGVREQEICSLRSRLDQLDARIGPLRQQIRQLRSAGSLRASNALVPTLNALVVDQNRTADTHNARVREYNQVLVSLGGDANTLPPAEVTDDSAANESRD